MKFDIQSVNMGIKNTYGGASKMKKTICLILVVVLVLGLVASAVATLLV